MIVLGESGRRIAGRPGQQGAAGVDGGAGRHDRGLWNAVALRDGANQEMDGTAGGPDGNRAFDRRIYTASPAARHADAQRLAF